MARCGGLECVVLAVAVATLAVIGLGFYGRHKIRPGSVQRHARPDSSQCPGDRARRSAPGLAGTIWHVGHSSFLLRRRTGALLVHTAREPVPRQIRESWSRAQAARALVVEALVLPINYPQPGSGLDAVSAPREDERSHRPGSAVSSYVCIRKAQ